MYITLYIVTLLHIDNLVLMFCPWHSSVVADSSLSVIAQLWNVLYSEIPVRGVAPLASLLQSTLEDA